MQLTARQRYTQLCSLREPFISRAKECSKYTVPSLFPADIDTQNGGHVPGKLKTPYQSAGAQGVNNLSSKLLLTLFPSETSFMKLEASPTTQAEINRMEPEEAKAYKMGIEQSFAKMEEAILREINNSADRTTLKEYLEHVIVTGGGLLYDADDGLRFYNLSQYVISRDTGGKILEIILKEQIAPVLLPPEIQQILDNPVDAESDTPVEIYTWVKRTAKGWRVHQEIEDKVIETSRGTYPLEACPWIAPRIIKISGSAYGRSYVEESLGDLKSLEALSEALVTGAACAAKVIYLVSPSGTTDETDLQDAASGDFVTGNAEDVTLLQSDKRADFQTTLQAVQELKDSLAHAYLQNSAIQRSGERVTAEEIRYMAGELEDVLGGVYSLLSQELQLPYVRAKLNKLMRNGTITSVNPKLIEPKIVTGLDALGKRHDSSRLLQFVGAVAQTLGPQAIAQYCDPLQIVGKLALSMGVSTEGIVKTAEQLASEQQQAIQQQQQQTMLEQGTAPAINQIGQMLQNQQNNQQGEVIQNDS